MSSLVIPTQLDEMTRLREGEGEKGRRARRRVKSGTGWHGSLLPYSKQLCRPSRGASRRQPPDTTNGKGKKRE